MEVALLHKYIIGGAIILIESLLCIIFVYKLSEGQTLEPDNHTWKPYPLIRYIIPFDHITNFFYYRIRRGT